MNSLIEVESLSKQFESRRGLLGRFKAQVSAVEEVDFHIERTEIFGLVGESGCGKSTLGKCLVRLYQPTSGHIWFDGEDIAATPSSRLTPLRKKMQLVFQDPNASLNPRRSIASSIADALIIHRLVQTKTERLRKIQTLLEQVEIPASYAYKYPSMLSGGQRQRVAIARSLAVEPIFLVLDEPTSSLDVSVQAKIVCLLQSLQNTLELTYMFITHDLALMRTLSHRTAVMYLGRFYEVGETDQLFSNAYHPYTRTLLASVPVVSNEEESLRPKDESQEGEVPNPASPPTGCAFHPRCSLVHDRCRQALPPLIEVEAGHFVRCYNYKTTNSP